MVLYTLSPLFTPYCERVYLVLKSQCIYTETPHGTIYTEKVCWGGEATKKGALKKRGSAATFAEKAKINKYGKRFSNLLDKLHQIIFAATEVYGTHGLRFNALLRSVASHAIPQPFGYDIDGLRARCISRLRQQISVGVLRGNHKVLADWRAHSWSTVASSA